MQLPHSLAADYSSHAEACYLPRYLLYSMLPDHLLNCMRDTPSFYLSILSVPSVTVQSQVGDRFHRSWGQARARRWSVPVPHYYPASSALLRLWGRHDRAWRGTAPRRHRPGASFVGVILAAPDGKTTIAMTRPDWVPFITAASSLSACKLQHRPLPGPSRSQRCRSLAGCRQGSLRVLLHALAAKCHRLIPKT